MEGPQSGQNSFKSEKLQFFNWAFKWVSNVSSPDEIAIDATQIATILQIMGFKLQSYENTIEKKEEGEVTISVSCAKSGMRAVLIKPDVACTCPNTNAADEGKFWMVSGSSQENLNRVIETQSSLLPMPSKERSMIIKEVLLKLFSMISHTDLNQNKEGPPVTTTKRNSVGRVRSLDDLNRKSSLGSPSPVISPPMKTSSPVVDLCKSVDQTSLNSDRDQLLIDILQNAKDSLDKALVLLPSANNTFTKGSSFRSKRISDFKISPTITSPTRSTTGMSTPRLPIKKTPSGGKLKINTPKKQASGDKRFLMVPSKIGSFRKKTPSSEKSPLVKREAPRSAAKVALSPNLSGAISKTSTLRGSNTSLASASSASKSKSGISSFGFKRSLLAKKTK